MSTENRKVLFIVKAVQDGKPTTKGEQKIRDRLGQGSPNLSYDVEVKDENQAKALDVRDKAMVIISALVDEKKVAKEFLSVAVPVIVTGTGLLTEMKMIGRDNAEAYGDKEGQTQIKIVKPCHPLAAGSEGVQGICDSELCLPWVKFKEDKNEGGESELDVVKIAAMDKDETRVLLFGYRSGSRMADGFFAPCKRVHLPFDYKIGETADLKGTGWGYWKFFDATVRWTAGEIGVRQFDEIYKEEWQEIQRRRELQYGKSDDENLTGFNGINAPENLAGLALSGGGIRSATFCLGLLQGLQQLKLLRVFDYCSTVSGGGYVGGWWSAWLSRNGQEPKNENGQEQQPPPTAAAALPAGDDEAARRAAEKARRDAEEAEEMRKRQAVFPEEEEIEPERLNRYRFRAITQKMAEGSLCANRDPIHHLRLFANYLTPRRGALSSDTWRAITIISRNLLMTWLILLPLLGSFILAAQFFFVLQPNSSNKFFDNYWTDYGKELGEFQLYKTIAEPIPDENLRNGIIAAAERQRDKNIGRLRGAHASLLGNRAVVILMALVPFAVLIGLMHIVYMRSNASRPVTLAIKDWLTRDKKEDKDEKDWDAWRGVFTANSFAHFVGGFALALLVFLLLALFFPDVTGLADWVKEVWHAAWDQPRRRYLLILCAVVMTAVWYYTFPWRKLPKVRHREAAYKTKEEWRREVWRNRIVRIHSKLLVGMVLAGVALVFAGYGHEVFDYIWRDPRPKEQFLDYVGKIGGWAAFAGAIAGTIFTALKAAPAGGHDQGEASKSSAVTNFIFAITPLLLIVVLLITLSWLGHEVMGYLRSSKGSMWPLTAISFVGVAVCLFFALFESRWRGDKRVLAFALVLAATAVVTGAASYYPWPQSFSDSQRRWLLRLAAICGWVVIFRLMLRGKRWPDGEGRFEVPILKRFQAKSRPTLVIFTLICLALAGLTVWAVSLLELTQAGLPTFSRSGGLSIFAFAFIILCAFYTLVEMIWGEADNRRSMVVTAAVSAMLMGLLLIGFFNSERARLIYIVLVMLGLALTWVVALGWMSDPNTLSMHGFYRGRIVRAYLGASNPQREKQKSEITESVLGDDLLLSELRNCQRGAPYHLLNTTLNLVGGRDLATAQRSSAMFVLSKLYCGSFRTGFRRSTEYMDGRFSLGTAVAVSGAAVSPGMGAGKTTASLAMLMTLMNVRLGYWAPTPSGEEWDAGQARLWPFYMMREFLSQTSDLSSYCYLTDGGHFDNLGLYSLVERGCRYIVVADAVADPEPCFSDLGSAIRRCRIDFGADIDLDITPFIKESKDNRFARQHYAVGTINYSRKHADKLGWKQGADLTGVVIYIKPSLLKDETSMRADVRQYEIENSGFPQESTVDQWFDEAQFESYRKLGEACAEAAFGKVREFKTATGVKLDAPKQDAMPMSPLKKCPADAPQKFEKALKQLPAITAIANSEPLTPDYVKALFKYLKDYQLPKPATTNGDGKLQDSPMKQTARPVLELDSEHPNGSEQKQEGVTK